MSISNSEDIWCSGNLLVMKKGAMLPDRCIKTNQPAKGKRFKATLYWHHPAIYLVILANLLIYLITALCVRKKAIVYVGVTEKILQKRRIAILMTWVVCLTGLILFVSSFYSQSRTITQILSGLGFVFVVVGLLGGSVGTTIVRADQIDDEYVWLSGCCQEYLATFPKWVK